MSLLRVAIVIHDMKAGGAERVTAHLANFFCTLGFEVHLITMAEATNDFFALNSDIVRHSLNSETQSSNLVSAALANLLRIRALRKEMRQLRPDVVIGMMTGAAVISLLATRFMNIRVIVSERTYPPEYPLGAIWEWLRKSTYPWADRVVMQTDQGLSWLKKNIPTARGIVIPNAANYPLPVQQPIVQVADYIRDGSKLLLAVGRLDEGKQFDQTLEAFSRLRNRHPDWCLAILGEGPERRRLEKLSKHLKLERYVSMPGRVGNIGEWYSRASLYVMSSRYEGFPNTLIEAMSYGTAVVSYDCDTGPRDIIRNHFDGILIRPVGDVEAFTEALDALMSDEQLRRNMGSAAAEVRVRFGAERVLGLWHSIMS